MKVQPQVGDVFILDGIERRVLAVDPVRGKLVYGPPDPDAEERRLAAVRDWKQRRGEYMAAFEARRAADPSVTFDAADALAVVGAPPEPSRNGTCALAEVQHFPALNAFYLAGRLEVPVPIPGAVVPQTAEFFINPTNRNG